ncbi:MAG: hypothetical protein ACT4QE_20745 [Anaerolineales bacterium]
MSIHTHTKPISFTSNTVIDTDSDYFCEPIIHSHSTTNGLAYSSTTLNNNLNTYGRDNFSTSN